MGRRSRQRSGEKLSAPASTYASAGMTLVLRGSLTPAARREYAALRAGGGAREDAWHRAVELLFERLAVSWTVEGVEWSSQRELLARFRAASADERAWVRDALRQHVAEWFPDVEAP
ncbi:MAG TPA: hypothetical protein VGW75_15675 [Solirubrobacteraceae bacterium]|nr:hypothetical protein [Solirubrobacteraceae bacterium]